MLRSILLTLAPFGFLDGRWLVLRMFVLTLALIAHPLAFDLRGFGLVVPPYARTVAFVTFEVLQFLVFAWAAFFWDTLPGMRSTIAYMRALRVKIATSSLKIKVFEFARFALVAGSITWLLIETLERLRDMSPAGPPRFWAATAFFVLERFVVIIGFLIAVESGDDDDPQDRRRSIFRAVTALLRLRKLHPALTAK